MSFFRKLFGGGAGGDQERIRQRVAELVEHGERVYVDDAEKALSFFLLALETADPAPADDAARQEIDRSALGRAVFSSWQCLEQLGRPASDVEAFLEVAAVKSPVTARRIEERILDQKTSSEESDAGRKLVERLREAPNLEPHELVATTQELWKVGQQTGAWWDLRAGGRLLVDTGHADLAERLLEAALAAARQRRGNVSSVHEVLGDLHRVQGRFRRAAGHYLLSCANGSPSKRAVHEMEVCLQSAGARHPERVREHLLGAMSTLDDEALVRLIDQLLASE